MKGFVLLLLPLLAACANSAGPVLPEFGEEQLYAAPESLLIGERVFEFEILLWRDFQPPVPPGGDAMIAAVGLSSRDGLPLPEAMEARYLWVLQHKFRWEVELVDEEHPADSDSLQMRLARGGPRWGPGITVDVFLGVEDGDGRLHLVRALDQWIHRTD